MQSWNIDCSKVTARENRGNEKAATNDFCKTFSKKYLYFKEVLVDTIECILRDRAQFISSTYLILHIFLKIYEFKNKLFLTTEKKFLVNLICI